MRARWILSFVALAVVLMAAIGSQAAGGSYNCRSSTPIAVVTSPPGGYGPACSFVVACPTTVSSCTVSANAIVSGIGYAGVFVEVPGVAGKSCAGAASCQTANVVKTMAG